MKIADTYVEFFKQRPFVGRTDSEDDRWRGGHPLAIEA
jgi:hypothetical protein